MTGAPPSRFSAGVHAGVHVESDAVGEAVAGIGRGERARVALLIRWIAIFVAIPTFSIGLVLYAYDPKAHGLHMVAFLILAALSGVVIALAPRLAARWVPADA